MTFSVHWSEGSSMQVGCWLGTWRRGASLGRETCEDDGSAHLAGFSLGSLVSPCLSSHHMLTGCGGSVHSNLGLAAKQNVILKACGRSGSSESTAFKLPRHADLSEWRAGSGRRRKSSHFSLVRSLPGMPVSRRTFRRAQEHACALAHARMLLA